LKFYLDPEKITQIRSVSDPDPHWIRIQQPQGSGSGIRIPNADPESGSSGSVLIFLVPTRSGFNSQTSKCSYTVKKSFSENNIWFSSKVPILLLSSCCELSEELQIRQTVCLRHLT